MTSKKRYVNGLDRIADASEQVAIMKKDLIELQPKLVVATEETEALQQTVEAKIPVVESEKEKVGKDEAAANAKAAECSGIKKSVEDDLAEAIPILNDAIKALDTIKKADIDLVKNMGNPPAGVKLAMEAVCVMLEVKPDKKADPDNPGKKITDYWTPSVKLLQGGFFAR